MSLLQYCRSGSRGAICIRVTLVFGALLAVLGARNVPPEFSNAPGVHSAVSADSHHDQRPRFDHGSVQWSVSADSFRVVPPAGASTPLTATQQLFLGFHSKGFHYNRPPPIS